VLILSSLVILAAACSTEADSQAAKAAVESFLAGRCSEVAESARRWAAEDSENPLPHALLNLAYTRLAVRDRVKEELRQAYEPPSRAAKVKEHRRDKGPVDGTAVLSTLSRPVRASAQVQKR
jgi:hypothetical protein